MPWSSAMDAVIGNSSSTVVRRRHQAHLALPRPARRALQPPTQADVAGSGAALALLRVGPGRRRARAAARGAAPRRVTERSPAWRSGCPMLGRIADRLARSGRSARPARGRGEAACSSTSSSASARPAAAVGSTSRLAQPPPQTRPRRVRAGGILDQRRVRQVADALAQAGACVVAHGGVALVAAGALSGRERPRGRRRRRRDPGRRRRGGRRRSALLYQEASIAARAAPRASRWSPLRGGAHRSDRSRQNGFEPGNYALAMPTPGRGAQQPASGIDAPDFPRAEALS